MVGVYLLGVLTGAGAALLVLALVCYKHVWEWLKEEWRYRRDGVLVWWAMRKEREVSVEIAPGPTQLRPMDPDTQVHLLARVDVWSAQVWCTCGQRFDGYGGKGAFNKLQDHTRG